MNTPNLTPEQQFWGAFYHALHTEAQKIRAELDSVSQALPDSADTGQSKQVNRPMDSTAQPQPARPTQRKKQRRAK